ncbi:reverse transcriptase domain-containing protein [Tanacetum coccineum]
MSVRLADRSFQYPIEIAKNMLVEVGKFTFPVDFNILEMEEDSKVPLILGRPFLHTANAVILVKQKQLNLGVGTERMIFNIDSAIKHSYSNNNTCFIIDEILEEDFDTLLDEGSKILHSIEGTVLEEEIFSDFDKFIAMRRLNPNIQEVVKKEIVKILDTGIIYPIADSPWVSPIHYVPKKGGITLVTNENDELVPTRTITGWRVWIDYRKLNEATAKDHFPLLFMDQILERLAGNKYFYFLDGFSGYFQISIEPMDQEKTTFTCPFGTYAYKQMPFRLCNAPATFQRCMLAIFHDMIEESVERCKDAHLVLNWEKCHFMVKEGIVLGHKVSGAGLEVDKAKINVISKLPPPTNIKDTSFEFNDECQKAFELLKEKLTCAPVIVSPNWNLPFELMCDASDFAVGAVLDANPRLIRWILLLKEFHIEIKDKKVIENVVADHLSRIDNNKTSDDSEVDDNFPRETLMEINTITEPCTVKDNPAIWSRKLNDALWAFRTAYKTPTCTTPYKLIYGKNCHLSFEIEHRAYWALKNCNPDLITVEEK